jgi:hypothetical protein
MILFNHVNIIPYINIIIKQYSNYIDLYLKEYEIKIFDILLLMII